MKKTITMNLSGIIFHIEEDAYETLNKYLNTIKSYFKDSDGCDEIMGDIESRIAEMFSEKVNKGKQAIIMHDVEEMLAQMGKPEDFAGEDAHKEEQKKESASTPSANPNRRKRVFRDKDNDILGGVCSGIANYFGFDPLWLRIIWAVSFFAFGTGAIFYFILWIIIPEAKTAAEKLEMHGEPVNAETIGKKVEEEMKGLGKKMENWGNEVKQKAENISRGKGKDAGMKIANFFSFIFGTFFNVFGKLLGVFIVIIGLLLLIAIISSLFGGTGLVHIDNTSFSLRDVFDNFFINEEQQIIATIAIILFFGVPLIMMIYGGLKLLLGIKVKNRFVGFTAGVLWLVGLIIMITLGTQISTMFSKEATAKNTFAVTQPNCDTLFLKMNSVSGWSVESEHRGKHFRGNVHKWNIIAADGDINFGFQELDIVRSETDSFEVVVFNEANGSDKKEALRFARNISYIITQKDSLIEFNSYFSIPKDEKWRAQTVHIEVHVPKNKMVHINKNMKNILQNVKNETDTWDGDMAGRRWIMGDEELRCVDCKGLEK